MLTPFFTRISAFATTAWPRFLLRFFGPCHLNALLWCCRAVLWAALSLRPVEVLFDGGGISFSRTS